MHRAPSRPVLFFDFDNTLTAGDVLDQIIEAFSPDEAWRDWEQGWLDGRLSALQCLRRQMEHLRVTRETLFEYLLPVRIDPAFAAILQWAREREIDVNIVSDSFVPLIRQILANNGIDDAVPVYANDLEFAGERLVPTFPYAEPGCLRSANAKASHFSRYRGQWILFAGDGRSDLDAALAADLVFAKSTLARELRARSIPFRPFETLEPVLDYVRATSDVSSAGGLRIVPTT